MKKPILVLVGVTGVLSGCATNGFKQFYNDQTGGRDLTKEHVVIPTGKPRLLSGTDPQKDSQTMAEDGYEMLGHSSFTGPAEDPANALIFGETIHAEVVVVYSHYTHTVSGSIPITTPTTQTSYSTANATAYGSNGTAVNIYGNGTTTTHGTETRYVPYSIDRYDQGALYWIKAKPPVFGVRVSDLSEVKRRELASNKGVEIITVIKGSPAFNADFMRGDVVKRINGQDVVLADGYYEMISKFAGKTVVIEGLRDGKSFKKSLRLNDPF